MEHDYLPYRVPQKHPRRTYTLEGINEARERLGKLPYRQALAIALGWAQADSQVEEDIAYLRGEPLPLEGTPPEDLHIVPDYAGYRPERPRPYDYNDYIWMRYGQ